MLTNSLYQFTEIREENNLIEAIVELDKSHEIFKGHFPAQPVLPGVCMMQMVREILETFFGAKLQLQKADDIRFSSMVDPTKNTRLTIQTDFNRTENLLQTKTKIVKADETVCCKMQAMFVFA